jgi:hypothetical protein
MSRFRLLLLGLLAVLAVGAVASASASAESCTGGTNIVFCDHVGGTLVGELVLGTSGLALLASIVGGAEAKFHCLSDDFHGTLGKLGASTGLILFLNCKEEKPAGCKLSTNQEKEINATFTAQQLSATLTTFTGSKAGEEFTKLEVVGVGCSIVGNYAVTGKQHVETPKGASSLLNQELVAKKGGSLLKLGVEAASFSSITSNAKLESDLPWLVMTKGI